MSVFAFEFVLFSEKLLLKKDREVKVCRRVSHPCRDSDFMLTDRRSRLNNSILRNAPPHSLTKRTRSVPKEGTRHDT